MRVLFFHHHPNAAPFLASYHYSLENPSVSRLTIRTTQYFIKQTPYLYNGHKQPSDPPHVYIWFLIALALTRSLALFLSFWFCYVLFFFLSSQVRFIPKPFLFFDLINFSIVLFVILACCCYCCCFAAFCDFLFHSTFGLVWFGLVQYG